MKDQTKAREQYYNNVRERIKKFQLQTEPEYSDLLKRIERYTETVANQLSGFFDIEYDDTYQECYLHMYKFWKTFDVNSDDNRISFCNTLAKAYAVRWAIRSLLIEHSESISKIETEFYENKNKNYEDFKRLYSKCEIPFSSMDTMICYYNLNHIEENLFRKQRRKFIEDALNTLTPKEKKVLGLIFFDRYSLDEVGVNFNVSRSRVRQIEAKALRKLRHPSRSRKLKGFLDIDYMYPKGFILENLLEIRGE